MSFSLNSSGGPAALSPSFPAVSPKVAAIAVSCAAASAFIAMDCSMVPLPSGFTLIVVTEVKQPDVMREQTRRSRQARKCLGIESIIP
jgi:hypothetical protein